MTTIEKGYFIYTRISKEWDYDKSLDDQKDILKTLAEKNWHKIDRYFEDIKSWHNWDRIEFDRMIELLFEDSKNDIQNRKYAWVYVFKLDRFSRNYDDFNKWEKLLDLWYRIISATETIENTPTWRLLFRMLSSFAIYESEKLSNRQTFSRISNIIQSNFKSLGLKLIFWYKFNWNNLVVDNKQKWIIIKIYDEYLRLSNKNIWKSKKDRTTKEQRYEEIWKFLRDDEKKNIRSYLLKLKEESKKNKNKKSKEKDNKQENNEEESVIVYEEGWEEVLVKESNFVENILLNKAKIKYNWILTTSIKINDELIINHINNLKKKNEQKEIWDEIIMDWINEIGEKIDFTFFFDDLRIIDDELYAKVRDDERKYNKNENKDEIIEKISNYTNIIYLLRKDWEKRFFKTDEKKWYYQYKTNKELDEESKDEKKTLSISEYKINDMILDWGYLEVLKNITEEKKIYIEDIILKDLEKLEIQDKKQYQIRQMCYKDEINERELEKKHFKITKIEDNKKLEKLEIEIEDYQNKLKEIEDKINIIKDKYRKKLKIFISIFSKTPKELLNLNPKLANEILKVIFDWIEVSQESRRIIRVHYSKFIQELIWN